MERDALEQTQRIHVELTNWTPSISEPKNNAMENLQNKTQA